MFSSLRECFSCSIWCMDFLAVMLLLLLEHNLKYHEFSIDLLLWCLFLCMGNKRNVSFTNPFLLLQANNIFITVIILILEKHTYPWLCCRRIITQNHHLHDIQVYCLLTNCKKAGNVLVCLSFYPDSLFCHFRYSHYTHLKVCEPLCSCWWGLSGQGFGKAGKGTQAV